MSIQRKTPLKLCGGLALAGLGTPNFWPVTVDAAQGGFAVSSEADEGALGGASDKGGAGGVVPSLRDLPRSQPLVCAADEPADEDPEAEDRASEGRRSTPACSVGGSDDEPFVLPEPAQLSQFFTKDVEYRIDEEKLGCGSQPVLVFFDWDDTLCPTTQFLKELGNKGRDSEEVGIVAAYGNYCDEKGFTECEIDHYRNHLLAQIEAQPESPGFVEEVAKIERKISSLETAKNVLQSCNVSSYLEELANVISQNGNVTSVIVTGGVRGWVCGSAELLSPAKQLLPRLCGRSQTVNVLSIKAADNIVLFEELSRVYGVSRSIDSPRDMGSRFPGFKFDRIKHRVYWQSGDGDSRFKKGLLMAKTLCHLRHEIAQKAEIQDVNLAVIVLNIGDDISDIAACHDCRKEYFDDGAILRIVELKMDCQKFDRSPKTVSQQLDEKLLHVVKGLLNY